MGDDQGNGTYKSFQNLNLGISVTPHAIQLNQNKITSDFKDQIRQAQQRDVNFQHKEANIAIREAKLDIIEKDRELAQIREEAMK